MRREASTPLLHKKIMETSHCEVKWGKIFCWKMTQILLKLHHKSSVQKWNHIRHLMMSIILIIFSFLINLLQSNMPIFHFNDEENFTFLDRVVDLGITWTPYFLIFFSSLSIWEMTRNDINIIWTSLQNIKFFKVTGLCLKNWACHPHF